MGAHARFDRMLVATRPDRILERRTVGQIISDMERQVASPEYAVEREAFYRERDARDAIERAKHEQRWAREAEEQNDASIA